MGTLSKLRQFFSKRQGNQVRNAHGHAGRHAGLLLGLGMVVLIWAGLLFHISMEYEQTGRAAQRELSNLATLFEEQLTRVLGGVDQTLLHLRATYLEDPDNFDLVVWSRRVQAISDFSFQTVIIGPDGFMVSSSISGPERVDLSDREHFRVHADHKVQGLFVSKPVIGRVSNRAAIQLSRRIDNPDGSFGGVVVMSIDPEYLARFYGSIDLGTRGAIMLVGTDAIVRVRKSPTEVNSGMSLAKAILFQALKDNPKAGVYVITDPLSRDDLLFRSWKEKAKILVANNPESIDSERMVAYRKVEGMPLIVTVASGLDDIFAGDYREQVMKVSLASLLSILILTVTLLIVRYQRGLALAKEAAEAGTRARSTFLAAMSHEIRTPMNAVLGLASSLIESPLNEDQRRSVAAINDSGSHLLRILNDILDFSKMEAGQVHLECTAFSPEVIAANVLSVIRARADAKGIAIALDCASDLPPALEGDASRISQILMNLVANAVKFTERGTVAIRLRCLGRKDGKAVVEWRVIDTGPGIASDRIDKLFGEFVQADNSIARRYGGSGLGLAICKRLVGLMGGDIGVVSEQGHGSEFWVRLTLPEAPHSAIVSNDSGVDKGEALSSRIKTLGRPAHVLLAEDNATNQMVVAKMLESFKISLTVVSDGEEAIEAVTKFPFDIVFMDMCMPNMDGLQAAAAIRRRGGHLAKLPIVALTANVFPEDIKACRDAGMDGFVAKPMRKRDLVEAITKALSKAGKFAPSSPPAKPVSAEAADIDPEKLDELQDEIGPDGLSATLAVFLRETEARLRRFEHLSCDADRATIKTEAHTLKGASATVGLARLSGLAKQLEAAAAEIAADGYAVSVERLKAAFAETRGHLDRRLSPPPAAVPPETEQDQAAPRATTQPRSDGKGAPKRRGAKTGRAAKAAPRGKARARSWEAIERAALKERLRIWKLQGRADYQLRLVDLSRAADDARVPTHLRERLAWQLRRLRRDLRDPESGAPRSIRDLMEAGEFDPMNPKHRLSLNKFERGNPLHHPPAGSPRGKWILGTLERPNAMPACDGYDYTQEWPERKGRAAPADTDHDLDESPLPQSASLPQLDQAAGAANGGAVAA